MADIGNIEFDVDSLYIKMPQKSIIYSQLPGIRDLYSVWLIIWLTV